MRLSRTSRVLLTDVYGMETFGDFAHAGGLSVGVHHTGWPQRPVFSSYGASSQPRGAASQPGASGHRPMPEHPSEMQPELPLPTALLLQPSPLSSLLHWLFCPVGAAQTAFPSRAFPGGNAPWMGEN